MTNNRPNSGGSRNNLTRNRIIRPRIAGRRVLRGQVFVPRFDPRAGRLAHLLLAESKRKASRIAGQRRRNRRRSYAGLLVIADSRSISFCSAAKARHATFAL